MKVIGAVRSLGPRDLLVDMLDKAEMASMVRFQGLGWGPDPMEPVLGPERRCRAGPRGGRGPLGEAVGGSAAHPATDHRETEGKEHN